MDVVTFGNSDTYVMGQVQAGSFIVGDTVCIPLTNGETAARTVAGLIRGSKIIDRAETGKIAGVLLRVDEELVEKGAFLHGDCELEEDAE